VSNDSGDRVTPAVVAFTDTEQVADFVTYLCRHSFGLRLSGCSLVKPFLISLIFRLSI